MVPRVQNFTWRPLRKALPVSKGASRLSKHIDEYCSRCGGVEDEVHMIFLCPFSKAAWFSNPRLIKIELLAAVHHSIPDMINALFSSGNPWINTTNLYTFL